MPTSLFSVHAATLKGASVTFSKQENTLTSGTKNFSIKAEGRLFFLNTAHTADSINLTKSLSAWHKTLGHMNSADILELEKVTKGMEIAGSKHNTTCNICDESKITETT